MHVHALTRTDVHTSAREKLLSGSLSYATYPLLSAPTISQSEYPEGST